MAISEVEIREFNAADEGQCRALYCRGIAEHTSAFFRAEVKQMLPYVIMLLSLVYAFRLSLQDVLIVLIATLTLATILHRRIGQKLKNFAEDVCNSDLKDVGEFYRDGSCLFVALLQDKVVGMVGIQHKDKHKTGQAELVRMSVSPSVRRRGIASKLLREAEQFCKDNKYDTIIVETSLELHGARTLYEKFGFRETSRQIHFLLSTKVINYEKQIKLV